MGLCLGTGFYEGGLFTTGLILLAELAFSRLEYWMLSNTPEVNLYMEYRDKKCLDEVLQMFREQGVKILNMEITRSKGSEHHNACVIFSLRLKKTTADRLVAEMNRVEGIVSIEEL